MLRFLHTALFELDYVPHTPIDLIKNTGPVTIKNIFNLNHLESFEIALISMKKLKTLYTLSDTTTEHPSISSALLILVQDQIGI